MKAISLEMIGNAYSQYEIIRLSKDELRKNRKKGQ